MPVRGVLISWAMPAESRPSEAIFSEVISWFWMLFFSVTSSKTKMRPEMLPFSFFSGEM